jgi:undecaprenyl-diphosphatase
MDLLLNIDLSIFYFVNHTIANSVCDWFFVLITTQTNWYIAYGVLIYFLLTKFGWEGRAILLLLILTIVISDQISSHLLKEAVARLRPCWELPDVRLLVPCGGGKSFPSSHAVNNFAFAVIMSYYFRRYRVVFYVIAVLVALSRVYVGVHYPSDVIAGAVIGYLVAFSIIYIYKKYIFVIISKQLKRNTNE